MVNDKYDVIIIGAGIQGAGVAQACAANGLRTLVLEKAGRAGSATSANSSKLVHGGLRYLETAQFHLVYECLRERKLLCRIAPGLVKLRKFYLPVYAGGKRSVWWVGAGLFLYWLLSGFSRDARYQFKSPDRAVNMGFRQQNLKGVFIYQDAQTDDRALTTAVLNSAIELGAQCEFNEELTEVSFVDGLYQVTTKSGKSFSAKTFINAAGPWINMVAQRFVKPVEQQQISLVKGIHLFIGKVAMDKFVYAESYIDGRPVFFMPWKRGLLIGTTEQLFQGDPDKLANTGEEERYLLGTYNYYYPHKPLSAADITGRMAGLRVLPADKRQLNRKNRETIFLQSRTYPNYYAIYGGKLTTYRSMSEQLVKKVRKGLGIEGDLVSTRDIRLNLKITRPAGDPPGQQK